ncbi:MAG: Gfo/Idh/MocA family oxidoreductase [Rhodobacteraceae bacterium]|nr:Gfo/Idh/MocA family oxidoreductase [Paracoccaceae bacterium]
MTTPLRYGIIGCGMMGQEHIRNIALLPDAEVVAVFEPDPCMQTAAKALAATATFVDGVAELLAIDALDVLLIASPNHLHVAQLDEIAARRPLPILVEKPLYTDPADACRIETLKSSYPAPIWVAMEYRYMPPIAAFLAEAKAATGGIQMLTIREHRFPFLEKVGDWNRFNRNTGGTLVEKCCHFFDLMRLVLNSEPIRIMASAGQAVNHLNESYRGETPDIWDHGYVIADFASGARAMLELCMFAEGAMYQEEISAIGPEAKIEALVPGPTRFWPEDIPAPQPKLILSPRTQPRQERAIPVDSTLLDAGDHNGSTFYQHRALAAAIQNGTPPEVSLNDGAAAVRIGLAAQQSAREGRTILL